MAETSPVDCQGVGLNASLLQPRRARTQFTSVAAVAAPLMLAIAGSALTPLPCAFSLAGVPLGTVVLLCIGVANNYTCVLMVRAASRLGVSGYEEVVLAAGGRPALRWCRVALILLLFGTIVGCLATIQETGTRAMRELSRQVLLEGYVKTGKAVQWLAVDPVGRIALIVSLTIVVLLPLSMGSLGEMQCVSVLGVALMAVISVYMVASAALLGDDDMSLIVSMPKGKLALSEAASTFSYAFYVQPWVVPQLRMLPPGEQGASTVVAAIHVIFVITGIAYLCVGLGGLFFFGDGFVPQDLVQGLRGSVSGPLAGVFCTYSILCFPPNVVPLRETLVRLYLETPPRLEIAPCLEHIASMFTPRLVITESASEALAPQPPMNSPDSSEEAALPPPIQPSPSWASAVVHTPGGSTAVLPPLQNVVLTTALVGGALGVTAVLPNASAQIFALTGATGVCAIGYIFPIYAFWYLPEPLGGARSPSMQVLTTAPSPPHRCLPEVLGGARRSTPADRWTRRLCLWLTQRLWPACVLCLGCAVSILTLIAVADQWKHPSDIAGTCAAPDYHHSNGTHEA
jgi:amino acid permease